MRYYKTRRLRIISGASLLLLLAGLPVLLTITTSARSSTPDSSGIFLAYASGLNAPGLASLAALAFAIIFCAWLVAGQRKAVGRRYLSETARRHHNTVELARTLAVILGAAGLIIGSLAGLYAAMLQERPGMNDQLPLAFLTPGLVFVGLFGGSALYALGRLNR